MEDRLDSLHRRIPDWFENDVTPAFESDLKLWRIFNALRLSLLIFAWLVVAIDRASIPYRFSLNFQYEYNRQESSTGGSPVAESLNVK